MLTTTQSLNSLNDLPTTKASFHYICDTPNLRDEKAYFYSGELSPDQEHLRTNITFERREDVLLHDLRGHLNKPRLSSHGFQFMRHRSEILSGSTPSETEVKAYVTETIGLLRRLFCTEAVMCYDYRFRKSTTADLFTRTNGDGSQAAPEAPAWLAHVDHTRDGGARRVRRHLSAAEEDEFLTSGLWRARIINVWRPLFKPVKDAPLAFCDAESLHDQDLFPVDTPSEDRVGEVYHLKFNHNQRWYWLSDQTPEEVSIFVSWDSDSDEGPSFCVHAAAAGNENGLPNSHTRESVEVRALVFTKRDLQDSSESVT